MLKSPPIKATYAQGRSTGILDIRSSSPPEYRDGLQDYLTLIYLSSNSQRTSSTSPASKMCIAIARHRPHSYLGKDPKRYTRAILGKPFSNTINVGSTSEEGMERMAERVVSDLQFVGFAGGRKLTLDFQSLHSCLYLCPLVYDL
jgi:hypothetical protein